MLDQGTPSLDLERSANTQPTNRKRWCSGHRTLDAVSHCSYSGMCNWVVAALCSSGNWGSCRCHPCSQQRCSLVRMSYRSLRCHQLGICYQLLSASPSGFDRTQKRTLQSRISQERNMQLLLQPGPEGGVLLLLATWRYHSQRGTRNTTRKLQQRTHHACWPGKSEYATL